MADLAILAIVGFAQVFALGFQSRNVNTGRLGWAASTSFIIGISQALVWRRVAAPDAGAIEAFVYAAAGAAGIICAMLVHAKWIHREVPNGRQD